MEGFFKKIKSLGDKKDKKLFNSLFQPEKEKKTQNKISCGGALGSGNKVPPGSKVVRIELASSDDAGGVGVKVERTESKSAIISAVNENSPAERAGLSRGDVVCFVGSYGKEEMLFDQFIAQVQNLGNRPFVFEVRRVTSSQTTSSANFDNISANEYVRRQNVIAAAEQREK